MPQPNNETILGKSSYHTGGSDSDCTDHDTILATDVWVPDSTDTNSPDRHHDTPRQFARIAPLPASPTIEKHFHAILWKTSCSDTSIAF